MRVVYSPSQTLHHAVELDGGQLILSWESPTRAVRIAERLSTDHDLIEPDPFSPELAGQVHESGYLGFLESCWDEWAAAGKGAAQAMPFTWPAIGLRDRRPSNLHGRLGYYSFAADCSIGPDTWTSVVVSAAGAHTAARLVTDDLAAGIGAGSPVAFALCRPPGHHASARQFGGYCYLNNAAIAAQALRNSALGPVAILDIDYHHGNGTQSIFYHRNDVVFVSIHADPEHEFPYFAGYGDELGAGDGQGANLNLPLPWGTGIDDWLAAFDQAGQWLGRHRPEALVVSLGVDTYEHDPISRFELTTDAYPTIGARVASLRLPTVLVMEGGYATDALADNVAGFIAGYERGR